MRILDIDADGDVEALSDGLVVLRYIQGFRGAALTLGAIPDTKPRWEPAEVEDYIRNIWYYLDVDGNGEVNIEDGQMILRGLFGFTGDNLVDSTLPAGATRTPEEIFDYIQHLASDL